MKEGDKCRAFKMHVGLIVNYHDTHYFRQYFMISRHNHVND